jgi:hypothetical protein
MWSAGAIGAAASTPAGGKVNIYDTPSATNQALSAILITGAIGDYGKALSIDKNGNTDANGNYVRVTLQKGTFEINSTALDAELNKAQPNIDKPTCSYWLSASDPVTVFNGTGLYEEISGTVSITITFAGYGPLYASGKHKGECNTSENAQPSDQYSSIVGTGTISFS